MIGRILKKARIEDPQIQLLMDQALESTNLWTRRVAIIHQLGWHEQTDTQRLFKYALTCAHEEDFFIRKAIGWSLRNYAWHAPDEVRAFLKANRKKLSPLTVREAEKHL